MLHRVDLFFVGAEHAPRIGERSSQLLERRLHLLEACLIPMRDFKCAGPCLWLNRISSCKAWTCRTSSSFEKSTKKRATTMDSACRPSLESGRECPRGN